MVAQKPEFYQPIYIPEPKVERGPCPRNREIYDAVRVQHLTYRAAAERFKVAPSRVGQILLQVEAWIARTGGGPTRTPRERVRISEYLHRARAESCLANLNRVFEEGTETRTDRVKVVAGKPDERHIIVKKVRLDGKVVVQAWKVDEARHQFETAGLEIPPEELTAAERVREAGLILEKDLAEIKAQAAKEGQMTNEVIAYGSEARAEEAAADESPMIDVQRPIDEEVVVAVIPQVPPPPEPEQMSPEMQKQFDRQKPLPMLLTERPSDEELERYWVINEYGRKEWKPPTITKGVPGSAYWVSYQPLPRNSAVQKKKKKPDA